MTYREFLTVIAASETLTAEVRTYATGELTKLETKNAKRRTTETAAQKAATETITAYVATLTAGQTVTSGETATALGVTTQKATALLKKGVALGILTEVGEVKTAKGKVKGYAPVVAEEEGEGEGTEGA